MLHRVLTLSFLFMVMAANGCGEGGGAAPDAVPTFSATGNLTVDDKPFGPATLTLGSSDATGKSPSISGKVDKDGKITFVTYGTEGVVAAGTYSVTMAGDIMSMSQVPATEAASIDIKSGDKSVDIKLKSIPGAAPVGGLAPVNTAQ